jgi:hypothetical protein
VVRSSRCLPVRDGAVFSPASWCVSKINRRRHRDRVRIARVFGVGIEDVSRAGAGRRQRQSCTPS